MRVSWVTMTTVVSSFLEISRNKSITVIARCVSRLAVGSSAKIIFGFRYKLKPIAAR